MYCYRQNTYLIEFFLFILNIVTASFSNSSSSTLLFSPYHYICFLFILFFYFFPFSHEARGHVHCGKFGLAFKSPLSSAVPLCHSHAPVQTHEIEAFSRSMASKVRACREKREATKFRCSPLFFSFSLFTHG